LRRAGPCDDTAALVAGVRVVAETAHSCVRLSLSGGTCATRSSAYESGSKLPRLPWREPSAAEVRILLGDGIAFDPGSDVAVIDVPPDLWRAISISGLASSEGGQLNGRFDGLRSAIAQYAASLLVPPTGSVRLIGISRRAPGLETSTVNPRTAHRIGLHLDSFFRDDLAGRSLAPNRLCLNVGREDRHLLFINLTLVQMYAMLSDDDRHAVLDSPEAIGDLFMDRFPDYPVVRLKIRPGEAYIAPTENIVHDSTTAENSGVDVSIPLLGRFGVRER
jgi:hypothetical protein